MSIAETIARVILRSNGKVHIAFRDIRSIYATPKNILALFSDPIDFINNQSYSYKESTFEINRKRVVLEDVLGLTLASVTSDKQLICDFPELFKYIMLSNDKQDEPLDMSSLVFENALSDEKSYLLRYYLEFTNNIPPLLTIKHNIKLRNDVQNEIIREILNTFFEDNLPEVSSVKDVSSHISQVENTIVYPKENNVMVKVVEYAEIWNISIDTVRTYIRNGRIKSAVKHSSGYYMIDKNEKPIDWDLRKGRKRKKTTSEKFYKRRSTGSAAEVEEHILKLDLFSKRVAPYIHTYEELDYYVKRNYHEVCWDGQTALIIDVNPEYISKDGVKNRDLMAKGCAPHIPDRMKDDYVFHIHHIGQNSTSPFAIIPEYDHNGRGLSSVFHPGTPNTELHGPEFEAQKINFWRNYLRNYDESGNFVSIEYINQRRKRNKK